MKKRKLRRRNKAGQIYILIAIVLCLAIFGLATVSNKLWQESVKSNFEKLSDNYALEGTRLLNTIVGDETAEVESIFNSFTAQFTSYAKSRSPQFQLIYAFEYDDILYLGNYLSDHISYFYPGGSGELSGCYDNIKTSVDFQGFDIELTDAVVEGDITTCHTQIQGFQEESITLKIAGTEFEFEINPNQPEIIIVSKEIIEVSEGEEEQIKVFLKGRLITT